MPHPAHRPLTLLLATACLLLGGAAQAQTDSAGPRYMTWANRPSGTTPADVVAAQAQAQAQTRAQARNGMIPRRVAPSQALSRPMMQPAPQVVPASRGLTPASAWLGPRVTPAYAPGSPDPTAYAADLQPVISTHVPPPPAPVRASAAETMPSAAPPAPQPTAEAAPAADPMAPRRDAPIFRMQPLASTAPTGQAASQSYAQAAPQGQQGARYYSVHRDAGRQPDPTVMPEPVFFDSVTMDLAEPPASEPVLRDGQGRRRAVANDDPSLP